MSHQVKLATLEFTNLDILKKAIQEEGLSISSVMHGYYKNWTEGDIYRESESRGTVLFGITIPDKSSPCGIIENENGTFELVGDSWGVTYNGTYGLDELSSRISQRYCIIEAVDTAEKTGFQPFSIPNTLERCRSKGYIDVVFKKRSNKTLATAVI